MREAHLASPSDTILDLAVVYVKERNRRVLPRHISPPSDREIRSRSSRIPFHSTLDYFLSPPRRFHPLSAKAEEKIETKVREAPRGTT